MTMMETILAAAPLERSQKERRRKALAGFSPRLHPARGGERQREREAEAEETGDRRRHR